MSTIRYYECQTLSKYGTFAMFLQSFAHLLLLEFRDMITRP